MFDGTRTATSKKRYKEDSGIDANQEWFDKVVGAALEKYYPKKMVESTMRYITISDEEPEKIIIYIVEIKQCL